MFLIDEYKGVMTNADFVMSARNQLFYRNGADGINLQWGLYWQFFHAPNSGNVPFRECTATDEFTLSMMDPIYFKYFSATNTYRTTQSRLVSNPNWSDNNLKIYTTLIKDLSGSPNAKLKIPSDLENEILAFSLPTGNDYLY